jgi:hypothetical protein
MTDSYPSGDAGGRKPANLFKFAAIGHRFISIDDHLTAAIQSVLGQILQEHKDTDIQLFCALAEGSDQLVAKIALSSKMIKLIVPLPLPEEKYLQGFASDHGRTSYHEIIGNAEKVIILTSPKDDETAYEHLGNYMLENCDVLIALWNGENSLKKGGTGELATKALQLGKVIYWIYADNGNEHGEVHRKANKNPGDIEILGFSS